MVEPANPGGGGGPPGGGTGAGGDGGTAAAGAAAGGRGARGGGITAAGGGSVVDAVEELDELWPSRPSTAAAMLAQLLGDQSTGDMFSSELGGLG